MGLDVLVDLIAKSNYPWLMSNVFDACTLKPLLDLKTKLIIEMNGIKVNMSTLYCCHLFYKN